MDPGYAAIEAGQKMDGRTSRLEKMMCLQMAVLLGLFITQVVIGVVLSAKVDDFMAKVDDFMTEANGFMASADDSLAQVEKVITPSSAATLISQTASTMILGNPNGSVAAWLQDLTENDWGMLASKSLPLAEYIRDAMKAGAAGKSCSGAQWATCPDSVLPSFSVHPSMCANGNGLRDCICLMGDPSNGLCIAGQWRQDCAPAEEAKECVMNGISDGAAAVASVLSKATVLQRVTPEKDIGEAAMSQGLLRLNWMVNWTGKQGGQEGVSGIKTLAKQCKSFVNNVLAVSWTGAFTDVEGQSKTWDAQSEVQDVTGWASAFCNALDS